MFSVGNVMLRHSLALSLLAAITAVGCVVPGPAAPPDDNRAPCGYPDAVEPMAADEGFAAYRWANGQDVDGNALVVDLAEAHCASSDVIDWSPFDALLFVSIPAW